MRERTQRGGNRFLLLSPVILAGALLAGCGSTSTQAPNPATLHQATVVAQAIARQTQTAKAHTIATVEALATAVVLNGNGAVRHFASQPSPSHQHAPSRPVAHRSIRPRAAAPRPTATPTASPTAVPATVIPVSVPPTATIALRTVPSVLRKGRRHHAKPRPSPTAAVSQTVVHSSKHHAHKHHSRHTATPTPVVVAVAQPTVHVLSKSELAYRARVLALTGKVTDVSTTLKQTASSIDPARADFDPSVLQGVTTSLDTTAHHLDEIRKSLTALKAPHSYTVAQVNMETAVDQYTSAVQHLRQAVSELEAGSRDVSGNDLTIGTSSIQQGDQALQSAQTLLAALH